MPDGVIATDICWKKRRVYLSTTSNFAADFEAAQTFADRMGEYIRKQNDEILGLEPQIPDERDQIDEPPEIGQLTAKALAKQIEGLSDIVNQLCRRVDPDMQFQTRETEPRVSLTCQVRELLRRVKNIEERQVFGHKT